MAHDVFTLLCARSIGFPRAPVAIEPFPGRQVEPGSPVLWPFGEPAGGKSRRGGLRRTRKSLADDLYEGEYVARLVGADGALYWPPSCLGPASGWFSGAVPYCSPSRERVPADELLAIHSSEPDWGMDDGLSLGPLQTLTGGSQGYRHLRYGVLCFRAGIPHRRALHFDRLAEAGFASKSLYWGVRFSAWVVHFIEDILTPVHTKPFTWGFLLSSLSKPGRLVPAAKDYHLNFERAVALALEREWAGPSGEISAAIEDAQPAHIADLGRDLLKWSRASRRVFPAIFRECAASWGGAPGEGGRNLDVRELEKVASSDRIRDALLGWFSLASSAVKGYLGECVAPRLRTLLGETSRRGYP